MKKVNRKLNKAGFKKDYPMMVGRIEVFSQYLESREMFLRALNFQISCLKKDFIEEFDKKYGGKNKDL